MKKGTLALCAIVALIVQFALVHKTARAETDPSRETLPITLAAMNESVADNTQSADGKKDLRFIVTLYGWLSSQSTNVDSQAIRQDVNDLYDMTDAAGQFRFDVAHGRLRLGVDATLAELSSESSILNTDVKLTLKQKLIDIIVGLSVYDMRDPKTQIGFCADVVAIGRYWDTNMTIDTVRRPILPGLPEETSHIEGNDTRIDPLVGTVLRWGVTESVAFTVRAAIGGFGIGDAADLSWDLAGLASFSVTDHIGISTGYRTLGYNLDSGDMETELRMMGPFLGMHFVF